MSWASLHRLSRRLQEQCHHDRIWAINRRPPEVLCKLVMSWHTSCSSNSSEVCAEKVPSECNRSIIVSNRWALQSLGTFRAVANGTGQG